MSESFIQRVSIRRALTLVFVIASANAAAYSWTQILIPSLGPIGQAFGINDKGQVTVNSADASKAGIYSNGIFTLLPAPPAGYSRVSALGINNAGAVVGGAYPPTDPTHEQGYVLIGSTYTFFSRPDWNNTEARAIAPSGMITGYNFSDDFSAFAGFVYNPATNTFTDATPPGSVAGTLVVTQGMNADGRISGNARLAGLGRYAFVWQQGTLIKGTRQLPPFLARIQIANSDSSARGINDAGVIVGFTARPDGTTVGFVGNDSRGFQMLMPPGGDAPGASVVCEGINNFRQVVCMITDANLNTLGDFIGTPDESE